MSAADLVLKLIMIGNSGVGKSCLLKTFMGEKFNDGYTSTIGVDFEIQSLTLPAVGNKVVNVQVWDTAGQERFRTITTSYYRSADGVVLVYDVTSKQSFEDCSTWLQDARAYAGDQIIGILIGNKADVKDKRTVDYKLASAWASEHNLLYAETSAKTDDRVIEAFTMLATAVFKQKQNRRSSLHRASTSGLAGSRGDVKLARGSSRSHPDRNQWCC